MLNELTLKIAEMEWLRVARPRSKATLIVASEENYQKLVALLETFSREVLMSEFDFATAGKKEAHWQRDKNVRDVLIHLYEWQQLLLNWVEANQKGENKPFLKEGYNWRNYGAMNMDFWQQHQKTTYEEALEKLKESHVQVMALVQLFSDEELFSKGIFDWVGGSTLGSYFVSSTSSHYEWALKKLRLYQKKLSN